MYDNVTDIYTHTHIHNSFSFSVLNYVYLRLGERENKTKK